MPTDDKALREKLDALIKQQPLDREGHGSDCALRDAAHYCSCGLVEYNTALDLLRRLEERETPCVWTLNDFVFQTECNARIGQDLESDFCPGCGHPVQVKQPQEKP